MYYMEEKIDVKFYSRISYALACIERCISESVIVRIQQRAGQILRQQKHFSSPVCNTLFWRRYAGSATTTVAATSFRRVPCGYRRPRRKIYGKSPFGGSQRSALWRARARRKTKKSVRAAIFIRSFTARSCSHPSSTEPRSYSFTPYPRSFNPCFHPSFLGA